MSVTKKADDQGKADSVSLKSISLDEMNSKKCHQIWLAEELNKDRLGEQVACDLVLMSEGAEFKVHKSVLIVASNFFRKMLTTEMKEKYSGTVEMKHIPKERLENLIEYLYTGQILITETNVEGILDDAEYADLEGLKSLCEDYLTDIVKGENCLKIRAFAQRYNMEQVLSFANMAVNQNFKMVLEQNEFLHLEFNDVFFLLKQRDDKCEEAAFDGIVRWVNQNCASRKQHFSELFCDLKLPLMSFDFLSQVVDEPLVATNLTCSTMLNRKLLQVAKSSEEENVKEVMQKFQKILNQLKPKTLYTVVRTFQCQNIATESELRGLAGLIFDKAISNTVSVEICANLCRCLSGLQVPLPQSKEKLEFRATILSLCQREFECSHTDCMPKNDQVVERKAAFQNLLPDEDRKRKRRFGVIRLIGALFKVSMLTESVVHNCIMTCFRSKTEIGYEELCILLKNVGAELDHVKAKKRMDQYIRQISIIANEGNVSNRVQRLLLEVVQLREVRRCLSVIGTFHRHQNTLQNGWQASSGPSYH